MDLEIYSDGAVYWELVYNGTLTGASFSDADTTNSGTQKDVAATAISGGIIVDSGFIAPGKQGATSISNAMNNFYPFTLDINGANPNIYTLVITSFTGTANTSGSMTWLERR